MAPIVYIDMLFLLNLLMDTITIYSTSLILRRSISVTRLFFAAALLSVYSCAVFFPYISILYSVLGKAAILTIATILAFPSHNFEQVIKSVFILFSISAMFGGTMLALIFATDFGTSLGAAVSNGELYLDIKASTLLLAVTVSYICVYIISYIKRRSIDQSANIVKLEISLFLKTIHLNALLDTGCSLRDPLFGRPAIILNSASAQKLLPSKIFMQLKQNSTAPILDEYASRYCVLPYCSIDNKKGFLHGFVPDKVVLDNKYISDCVIALSNSELSHESQIDAIFNPSILLDKTELCK